jgi:hypothetical protein
MEWQESAVAGEVAPGQRGFEKPAVVCQFGVMFVPDKIGAFREARRVLAR